MNMRQGEQVTAARAVIFSNGSYADLAGVARRLQDDDYLVCADGALKHLHRLGRWPHLLVGDFDSIDLDLLQAAREQGVELLTFDREKDYTDTELAWQVIKARGHRQLLVVGGWGSRLDHSLANLLLFAPFAQQGFRISFTDGTTDAYFVSDKVTLRPESNQLVSIMAFAPVARGVTAKGFHWPLTDATLSWGQGLGISNIPVATECSIEVEEGLLLVVVTPRD